MSNLLWIDQNIYSDENKKYTDIFKSFNSLKLNLFKKVDEAITFLKSIKFEETIIIVSGRLYSELIENFKQNLKDMYISPQIIVFTRDENSFLNYNKNYKDKENKFYNFCGIATKFPEIIKFLNTKLNNSKPNTEKSKINSYEKVKKLCNPQLTFEYIDNKEKLMLPLFFKTLIDNTSKDNMEKYTNTLYNIYSKNNNEIKEFLGSIKSIPNIPIEILSKYYARLYTAFPNFFKDLKGDIKLFTKVLYEGLKLKSFPLSNNNILYNCSILSKEEINTIKNYMNKKIEGLPGLIMFSKLFLSFSKDQNEAEKSWDNHNKNKNSNLFKVLFILEKDDNMDYHLATHIDLEKVSFYPNEKEVLFLPFSSFEIKDIKEISTENEIKYEIKLSYLTKYLKDIKNDKNLITNEIKIPDSEFKKQLIDFGIIKKDIIKNTNSKVLYNSYRQYEKDIRYNFIIGEFYIDDNKYNENFENMYIVIQIMNSFENFKKIKNYKDEEDDWKNENEKEIMDNVDIIINGKDIGFTYFYRMIKGEKYKIEYSFKNNLTKIDYLFADCDFLINLDFSNFNSQDVTNMRKMFNDCSSLKSINFKNLKTQNVNDMSFMFKGCVSLTNLDLSNFNTQNVLNMSCMFAVCKSLINLNLSNFNTQNVINMSSMFNKCKTVTNINLSNFNTQNATDMNHMFSNCKSLKKENIFVKDKIIIEELNEYF